MVSSLVGRPWMIEGTPGDYWRGRFRYAHPVVLRCCCHSFSAIALTSSKLHKGPYVCQKATLRTKKK